jgi:hypothetical protein
MTITPNPKTRFQQLTTPFFNDLQGLIKKGTPNSLSRKIAWRALAVGIGWGLGFHPTGAAALAALKTGIAFTASYHAAGIIMQPLVKQLKIKNDDNNDNNRNTLNKAFIKTYNDSINLIATTIPAAACATGLMHALNGQASLAGVVPEILGEFKFNLTDNFANSITELLDLQDTMLGKVASSAIGVGLNMINFKKPQEILKTDRTDLSNNFKKQTLSRVINAHNKIALDTITEKLGDLSKKISEKKAQHISNLIITPLLGLAAGAIGLRYIPL